MYLGVTAVIVGTLFAYLAYSFFSTPGTCFDGSQNQGERGVDCGGPCARMCISESRDPIVVWARALPSGEGNYTAVAYVRNPQASLGAATYGVGYSFRLLGEDNHLILEVTGTADLPAVGTIPILVPNTSTGSRVVARTQFSFLSDNRPIVWTKIPAEARPVIRIQNQSLTADGTRLSATVTNDTNLPVRNLSVVGVLFDGAGNAVAASRSLVAEIAPESQAEVVFTWLWTNEGVVRAEITPLPALPPNPQP